MIRIFWRSWRLGSEDLDQRKHGFGRLALTRRRDQDWCHGLPVAVLGEVVVELRLELWEGVELLDVKRVHDAHSAGFSRATPASSSRARLASVVWVGLMIKSAYNAERPRRRSARKSRTSARPVRGR
jgi:hypothetical protein